MAAPWTALHLGRVPARSAAASMMAKTPASGPRGSSLSAMEAQDVAAADELSFGAHEMRARRLSDAAAALTPNATTIGTPLSAEAAEKRAAAAAAAAAAAPQSAAGSDLSGCVTDDATDSNTGTAIDDDPDRANVSAGTRADGRSSSALYDALDALEAQMAQDARATDASRGRAALDEASSLRSQSLKDLEAFGVEVRSFVSGVKTELDRLSSNAVERVQLEAGAFVSIADFVVRRALLDGGRALAAAASSTALMLGASPPPPPPANQTEEAEALEARDEAMPFASRVAIIDGRRNESTRATLPGGSEAGGALVPSAASATEQAKREAAERWLAEVTSQREGLEAGALLLKESVQLATAASLEAVSKGARLLATELEARGQSASAPAQREMIVRAAGALTAASSAASAASASAAVPDPGVLRQRALQVSSAVQEAAGAALATTRADYASYLLLQRSGQLPTLLEEAADLPALRALPRALPRGLPSAAEGLAWPKVPTTVLPSELAPLRTPVGGRRSSDGVLSSLRGAVSPTQQRVERMQRAELDSATKQLRLAAAIGDRAVKDSGDALVFGVLPAVSAVGKVAVRRAASAIPEDLAASVAASVAASLAEPLRILPAELRPKAGPAQVGTPPSLEARGAPTPSPRPPTELPPRAGLPPQAGAVAGLMREVAEQMVVEYAVSTQRGVASGALPDVAEAVSGRTRRLASDVASEVRRGANALALSIPVLPSLGERASAALEAVGRAGLVVPAERELDRGQGDRGRDPTADASSVSQALSASATRQSAAAPSVRTNAMPLGSRSASKPLPLSAATLLDLFDSKASGASDVPGPTSRAVVVDVGEISDDTDRNLSAPSGVAMPRSSPLATETQTPEIVVEAVTLEAMALDEGMFEGTTTAMYTDVDGRVAVGADSARHDAVDDVDAVNDGVVLDVAVTSEEEVQSDDWASKLVEIIDLAVLAAEVALDALSASPAARMATAWLEEATVRSAETDRSEPSASPPKARPWVVLRSLSADDRTKRKRSEASRAALIDALTRAIERR